VEIQTAECSLEKIVCILKKPMHINNLGASQHCTADPLSLIEIER
jgi:hypothetical protein